MTWTKMTTREKRTRKSPPPRRPWPSACLQTRATATHRRARNTTSEPDNVIHEPQPNLPNNLTNRRHEQGGHTRASCVVDLSSLGYKILRFAQGRGWVALQQSPQRAFLAHACCTSHHTESVQAQHGPGPSMAVPGLGNISLGVTSQIRSRQGASTNRQANGHTETLDARLGHRGTGSSTRHSVDRARLASTPHTRPQRSLARLRLHDHLGRILQVEPEAIRQATEADRREEVDRETCVSGILRGEHPLEYLRHVGVIEALPETLQSHVLRKFLTQDEKQRRRQERQESRNSKAEKEAREQRRDGTRNSE